MSKKVGKVKHLLAIVEVLSLFANLEVGGCMLIDCSNILCRYISINMSSFVVNSSHKEEIVW